MMDYTHKQQILEEYCGNQMAKLKQLCGSKINKIGGIAQMDYDDIYSIALEVLRDSTEKYEYLKGCSFAAYLNHNLQNRIDSYIRDRNRDKRKCPGPIEYLDASAGAGLKLYERTASSFDLEEELAEKMGVSLDERVFKYLEALTARQRSIAGLIMQGCRPLEIRMKLKLTEKQYQDALKDMRTFEKSRILKYAACVQTKRERTMQEQTQTLEKSKPDKLSIASIIKKIDNYTIRFDHPLQRESEQWSPAMKGNLISDILQRNPIPPLVFAEQVANGLAVIWDLDGKQRCTNVYSFKNDGYKITKNIRRWNISYQAGVKDKNGKTVRDENGFPKSEKREFDIRGKKFSDLPEELQDRFLEYNFEIVQYLNCSGEDIAYHIARYNEGKPMSASQKGITRLGEEFAAMVKSISAMPFFKEQGGYKVAEGSNGTVNRVVIESVMAANFINEWKKKQEDMCEYIKDNATAEMFESFEDMVVRISKAGTEETFNMFDSKDSFLWFGLFARFGQTGFEDEKFIEFMAEFGRSLHGKKIKGVSYDDLNGKSTKDKNVVVEKISHLQKLLSEFLHMEEDIVLKKEEQTDIARFVKENVSTEATAEEIAVYEETIEALLSKTDSLSRLSEKQNRPSLVALAAFSFCKHIDMEEWFRGYIDRNRTYKPDQKENYLHMKKDLLDYYRKKGTAA